MASEFSELDAAGHLESGEAFLDDAARLLDGGARPGWVVTAAFYSALHVVSAYVLARHRAQVVAHRDRADWFRAYPELASDRFAFVSLKRRSEGFRYYGDLPTRHGAEEAVATARRIAAKWGDRARKATP